MKVFMNKSIWKKIAIILVIVILFQFVASSPVQADAVEFGGKLLSPVLSLIVTLSDGIMGVISRVVMGTNTNLIHVDMDDTFWDHLGAVIIGIIVAAIALIAIVATAGLAAVIAGALSITATATFGVGTVIAVAGARTYGRSLV